VKKELGARIWELGGRGSYLVGRGSNLVGRGSGIAESHSQGEVVLPSVCGVQHLGAAEPWVAARQLSGVAH
jgi:hypothetical protein